MDRNRLLQFLTRTGLLMAYRVVGAAGMFAVNLLIARHYGAEQLGIFAICTASLALLGAIMPMGFNMVGAIFAAEYTALKKPGLLKGFIHTGLAHIGYGGLIILAGGCVFMWAYGLLNGVNVALGLSVWASAVAAAIIYMFGSIAIGLNLQLRGMFPETIVRSSLILACIVAIVLAAPTIPLWGFMVMMSLATWLAVAVAFLFMAGPLKPLVGAKTQNDQGRWRRAAYPWASITVLSDFLIDILLLVTGFFAPSVEIALLHVCFRFRILAGFGMKSIHYMLLPDITSFKAVGQLAEMRRGVMYANLASTAYGLAVIIGFAVLGPWMLGMFGSEFVVGQGVLMIVASTMMVRAIFGPAPEILAIHDKHFATAIVMALSLLLALVVIAILYPSQGVMGVATAYLVSSFAAGIALWIYAREKIGVDCSIFAEISMFKLQAKTG